MIGNKLVYVGVKGICVHAPQICVTLQVSPRCNRVCLQSVPSKLKAPRNSTAIKIQGALDVVYQSAGVRFEDEFYCEVSEILLLLP